MEMCSYALTLSWRVTHTSVCWEYQSIYYKGRFRITRKIQISKYFLVILVVVCVSWLNDYGISYKIMFIPQEHIYITSTTFLLNVRLLNICINNQFESEIKLFSNKLHNYKNMFSQQLCLYNTSYTSA